MEGEPEPVTPFHLHNQESKAQTDGTFRLGDVCQPVIIEVKEDIGQGNSHPLMQLLAYYAKVVVDKRQTRAIVETYFPAIGIVCFGNHLEWVVVGLHTLAGRDAGPSGVGLGSGAHHRTDIGSCLPRRLRPFPAAATVTCCLASSDLGFGQRALPGHQRVVRCCQAMREV